MQYPAYEVVLGCFNCYPKALPDHYRLYTPKVAEMLSEKGCIQQSIRNNELFIEYGIPLVNGYDAKALLRRYSKTDVNYICGKIVNLKVEERDSQSSIIAVKATILPTGPMGHLLDIAICHNEACFIQRSIDTVKTIDGAKYIHTHQLFGWDLRAV